MDEIIASLPDLDALRAFALVARERNMRKAAELLHISQPPLSRKIRRLEERLGLELFARHSDGMELTEEGRRVLTLILPVLSRAAEVSQQIANLANNQVRTMRWGFTTAFEQAVFEPIIACLEKYFEKQPRIVRGESPQLVRQILKEKLDAAFVALPLHTQGLPYVEIRHAERLAAVLPQFWPEASGANLNLKDLNGRPIFWFQRRRNPAYYDITAAIFQEENFLPVFIEEPLEHDVLLARIARGDGWCLLPESFRNISRTGVVFRDLEDEKLKLALGLVCRDEKLLEELAAIHLGNWY